MARTVLDMFDLHGRVALVSGGASGMGRAMAMAFAEAGADLLLPSHHNVAGVKDTAEYAKKLGRRAVVVPGRHDERGTRSEACSRRWTRSSAGSTSLRARCRPGISLLGGGHRPREFPAGRARSHDGAVLLLPGGGTPHAEAGQGQHHQHGLHRQRHRPGPRQLRLQRRHGRGGGDDPGAEHRMGQPRGAGQRHPARRRSPTPGFQAFWKANPDDREDDAARHPHRAVRTARRTSRGSPSFLPPTPRQWITGVLFPFDGGNLAMNAGGSPGVTQVQLEA